MAEQILPLTTLTVKGVTYTLQDKRVDAILEQLSGITNVIDDTTTGIGTTWSSDKINTLISNFVSLSVVVVDSLPVSDIDTHTIYLLPKNPNDNNNVYTEYININGTWEEIGDTEIDLTNYTTKVFVAANYAQKTDTYTKGEVDTLIRNITDENTEYLGDETTIHINGVTKVISALYTSNDFKNAVKNEQLQADWSQQNSAAKDYIKNKPDNLVHTSNIAGLLKNDGTVDTTQYISGNCLRLVNDLNNFDAPEGTIIKYVGPTNSKYHSGWNYKKVYTQKSIPSDTYYIDVVDNSGNLASIGIPNGRYYKIVDENDAIKDKIRNNLFVNRAQLPKTTDCAPVERIDDEWVPIIGAYGRINSEFKRVVSYAKWNDNRTWEITFENGEEISGTISSQIGVIQGSTFGLPSDAIYESASGIRIYTRYHFEQNKEYRYIFVFGDYVERENEDFYPVIVPEETYMYEVKTTTEPVVINSEWQQCDTQPSYSNKIAELEARIAALEGN